MASNVAEDRLAKARDAYLSVFEGPWGIKASTEDALLAVLVALYPSEYNAHDSANIYKLRADGRLEGISEWMWEDLECEGFCAEKIAAHLVPRLEEVLDRVP